MARKSKLKVFAILICFLCAAGFTVFGGFSMMKADAASKPVIDYFNANPTSIKSGQTTVLSWKVRNAERIEIFGLEKQPEDLPLQGTLEVFPEETTSYVLRAYPIGGGDGVVSRTVTVNVDSPNANAVIEYFKASKYSVNPGETVVLSWKVKNAKDIRVIGIEKELECTDVGSVEVFPETTTTYILEVTGYNGGVVTKSLDVVVKEQNQNGPEIVDFRANKYEVRRGELVSLSWQTKNAKYCEIELDNGKVIKDRKPNGTISVTPQTTTSYTLVAYDMYGKTSKKMLTIKVK